MRTSKKDQMSRRDFAAITAGGLSIPWGTLLASPADEATESGKAPLEIAEWSYFWVGVERAELAKGTVVNGKQMYVEYQIPAQVRHPYAIVLVHGGGGQGLDWLLTPDGRPGWATHLLQEGYKVYIVDRPGHGRSPYHPDALGPITPVLTYSTVTGDFMRAVKNPNPRWKGTGDVGDPLIDEFQAGQNSAPQDTLMAHGMWAK